MRHAPPLPRRLTLGLVAALAISGPASAQQATVAGTLDGHTEPVYAIAWTPDGQAIVTGGFDDTVRVWDAATRKEVKALTGHESLVLTVAPSPNGEWFLSGGLDKSARLWARPRPGASKELAGLPAGVHALVASPDGARAAFASAKTVSLWDLNGPMAQPLNGHAGDVESLAWRADGAQIASGDKARAIRLWNAADGAAQGVIETPADTVLGLAYLPNNAQLVSAGSDGLARLWQLPVEEPKVADAKGPVKLVAFSLDGNKVATAGDDKVVRIWNAADGGLAKEIPAGDPAVVALALKADGGQVAFALANNTIRVCNTGDGNEVKKIEGLPSPVTALAFQPDGSRVAFAGEDNQVRVYGVADAKEQKAIGGHGGRVRSLLWAPNDGNFVYSACDDKVARLLNIAEGKPVRDFGGHTEGVLALAVSRDGGWLATGSSDKNARLFQAWDGKLAATLPGHGARSRRSASPRTSSGSSPDRRTTR